MGADGSRSPTNAQHLCATAPFSSHFTEVCKVDSHVSRRFPSIRLKNRRTFALFTITASTAAIHTNMISNTPYNPIRLSSSYSKRSCIFIGERRPARGRPGRPRLISRRGVFQNGTIQLSFIWFVFVKERTPFRQFFFAHLPCLVRYLCKAVLDALPLRFWVNRQINHLAFRSYLLGDPSQRRPFVFAPKSEIQDDVGLKLKST